LPATDAAETFWILPWRASIAADSENQSPIYPITMAIATRATAGPAEFRALALRTVNASLAALADQLAVERGKPAPSGQRPKWCRTMSRQG